jgi:predicted transcriptional regulator
MPDSLPDDVQRFLSEQVGSIAQLELLLLLHGQPAKSWTVEEAAKSLYTAASMTQPLLDNLVAAGLIARQANPGADYRYAPASPELGKLVEDLARLYRERRVTVINAIYSAPTKKLQNFADAFRIRKKEEED